MHIDFADLSPSQRYHLMVQTVVPRPVAWVLTAGDDGSHNLAPFSYFMAVGSDPATLAVSVGRKAGGEPKDTWRNIAERGDFVVHIAGRELLDPLNDSSAALDYGDSEIARTGLELTGDPGRHLPRLSAAKVALWCRRYAVHEIGTQGLIVGEVHAAYVADDIATADGGRLTVDAAALDPIARLGGTNYMLAGEIVARVRPS